MHALNTPVLLFDLGGVLVESSGRIALMEMLPGLDETAFIERWCESKSIGLFERGRITPQEFAEMFIQEWEVDLDIPAFLKIFADWVPGFYAGAIPLVEHLRKRYRVGCLSNTNAIHWEHLPEVETIFDFHFASHLTGHMKPDRAAYEHVLSELDVPAENIYFFDDLIANITAAKNLGMNAILVHGLAQTETALRDYGLHYES